MVAEAQSHLVSDILQNGMFSYLAVKYQNITNMTPSPGSGEGWGEGRTKKEVEVRAR